MRRSARHQSSCPDSDITLIDSVDFEHFVVSAGSTSVSLLVECFEFSQVPQAVFAAATELAHSPARTRCERIGVGRESYGPAGLEDRYGVMSL